jgi:transposase
MTSDHAPWHGGAGVAQVLEAHPQLRLYRFPRYRPQLNVLERFWRVRRRRATPHRLCTRMVRLRAALRQKRCYFQTRRQQVLSLIESPRKAKKAAKLAAA